MARLLDSIQGPSDLKGLSIEQLQKLSEEIRGLIIDTVSRNGGHLAANLGVVELTIALLRVFDPSSDRIVWDVSHQCYTYKILTGRKDRFGTIRQHGGISGFLNRTESPYDTFGTGHAGTAISAALGMAVARDKRGSKEHVVAVLGDGAAGCGTTFEGLNNLSNTNGRFIVILNDNEMSISANVGAMARYLGGLLANPRYNRWKKSVESVAWRMHLGWLRHVYFRIEEFIKGLFLRNVIFEEFGLRYVGPIDGHDFNALFSALAIACDADKPILLHVSTQKGRGYAFAEDEPEKWHGAGRFDVESGEFAPGRGVTYSETAGRVLETLAAEDKRVVALTAAMACGTGLSGFSRRFPDRFFDVGISEEHAVVFSAGLAAEGMRPFFAVYSTFAQRVIDYIIHDVCLQKLPVVFCIDRAGIVGDDGPTHHGVFDIALLRSVPNLILAQPRDRGELARMLRTALEVGLPMAIRYPRGTGPDGELSKEGQAVTVGEAEVVKTHGSNDKPVDVRIWALGDMVETALMAADQLSSLGVTAGVVNARWVRPLDTDLLEKHAETCRFIVTIENGVVAGGFGSAVQEALSDMEWEGEVLRFGWPDEFIPHGSTEILMKEHGLLPEQIARRVADHVLKTSRHSNG